MKSRHTARILEFGKAKVLQQNMHMFMPMELIITLSPFVQRRFIVLLTIANKLQSEMLGVWNLNSKQKLKIKARHIETNSS